MRILQVVWVIAIYLLSANAFAEVGSVLYQRTCSHCHDAHVEHVPDRDTLQGMSPEQVLQALEAGPMVAIAARLTGADRRAIAEFVTGKSFGQAWATIPLPAAMCGASADGRSTEEPHADWLGWGNGITNNRFQDSANSSMNIQQIPRLKLKWAFGFPGEVNAYSQPTISGNHVLVSSQGGKIYSLNTETGCIRWWFQAAAAVRVAVSIGTINVNGQSRMTAFFGDVKATAYALDAASGELLWKTTVDDQSAARITGSPTFFDGKLLVPISSVEEGLVLSGQYECCRFRGSVVALNGATGARLCQSYTIPEEPHKTTKNANGVQFWGPSGASVWTSPTVDSKRHAVYVTTGNNYSDPATLTSDAIVAMDLDSGKLLWSRQMIASDSYNISCRLTDKSMCPKSSGPDFDFGSPPILALLRDGRRALIAGQKSGIVYAIDPDHGGKELWHRRVGHGGANGGVQWGSATDEDTVYVGLSDVQRIGIPSMVATELDPEGGGGTFALRLNDGRIRWHAPPSTCGDRKRCSPAQSAAVTAIHGAVFSGSLDGHLRAYATNNGAILWDFDSEREYQTVNGVPARGGSLDGPGPAIANGMVFVNSGYALWGGAPGNVLLAFSVDGQ